MYKKLIIGGTLTAFTVLLGACGMMDSNNDSESSDSMVPAQSSMMVSDSSDTDSTSESSDSNQANQMSSKYGEIIGKDESEDMSAKDITKPGDTVMFEVPASDNEEYLHFAFMHAKSGDKGWYFAPESENGIKMEKSMFDNEDSVDITDKIALFEAPDADTAMKVSEDDGDLKYGPADDFMKATVKMKGAMYEVTIENTSSGDFETPFSSGVWAITDMEEKGFDHEASAALSTLATSGKRADLYDMVEKEMK